MNQKVLNISLPKERALWQLKKFKFLENVVEEIESFLKVLEFKSNFRCSLRYFLRIFVGFEIITKVPPTLHTPLMSGSNAISGIAIVGAIISSKVDGGTATYLGLIAVIFATVNVVGGFMVTDRMLKMFKRK